MTRDLPPPPRFREDHPRLHGLSDAVRADLWPKLATIDPDIKAKARFDEYKSAKAKPYFLAFFAIFAIFLIIQPIISFFLLIGLFVFVFFHSIIYMARGKTAWWDSRKAKKPEDFDYEEHEAGIVRFIVEKAGFAYNKSAPSEIYDYQHSALRRAGLISDRMEIYRDEYFSIHEEVYHIDFVDTIYHLNERADVTSHYIRGPILTIGMRRPIVGRTVLRGRRRLGPAGRVLWQVPGPGAQDDLKPMTVESTAFARLFDVFASDPVEARTLLTPAVMERFMAIGLLFETRTIDAVFEDGHAVIVLDLRRNFLQLGDGEKLVDPDAMVKVAEELAEIFALVDVLNLDNQAQPLGLKTS